MPATAMAEVEEVRIEPEGLIGLLGVPHGAQGIVVFAHGSGSGRLSPRNNHVAAALRQAGLATLLVDLLTSIEERDRRNVFDIDLLASRLALATHWAAAEARTGTLVHFISGQALARQRRWWPPHARMHVSPLSCRAAAGPIWRWTRWRPCVPRHCFWSAAWTGR